MVISLTGFMGCGKSSTGRALAERLGARFVDLDAEIVAREGRPIPDIFRDGGEAAFRAVELASLRAVLDEASAGQQTTVLALGGGALTVPAARDIILAETECVFLRTRLETIRERLGAADASRPLFADAEARRSSPPAPPSTPRLPSPSIPTASPPQKSPTRSSHRWGAERPFLHPENDPCPRIGLHAADVCGVRGRKNVSLKPQHGCWSDAQRDAKPAGDAKCGL